MKKHYLHLLLPALLCLAALSSFGQVQQQLVLRYNGPGSNNDRATAMTFDPEGYLYVLGNGGFKQYTGKGQEYWSYHFMYFGAGRRAVADHAYNIYITEEHRLIKGSMSDYGYSYIGNYGGNELKLDASGNVYVGGQQEGDFATAKFDAAGQLVWAAHYNGPGNGPDSLTGLAVDSSGNVYVCGVSRGLADDDFTTIKYNAQGQELWVQRYGGGGSKDAAYDLAIDTLGNVYVTGESGGDYATVKYSPSGALLWVQKFNGPAGLMDAARALALDSAGNLYVTGGSTGVGSGLDYTTLKYNTAGKLLWEQRYNGTGNDADTATLMALDASGNIIITGSSMGKGSGEDYATLKYDPAGNLLWANRFSQDDEGEGGARDLLLDREGNVYVTGVATVRYNAAGQEQWSRHYYKSGHGWDAASAMVVDSSGNMYLTGNSEQDFGHNPDYATVKFDPNGKMLWVSRYESPVGGADFASAIAVDRQGNTYITGWSAGKETGFDYTTIKYNAGGKELWVRRYNGPGNGEDKAVALVLDSLGNVYVTGSSRGSGTGLDYATLKYDSEGRLLWEKRYDGKGSDDKPAAMTIDPKGRLYITGQGHVPGGPTQPGYLTLSYDSDGNQRWVRGYGSGAYATALTLDALGKLYITGSSPAAATGHDFVTLKYDPDGRQLWAARYNGPENGADRANDLVADQDGNVYVTGVTQSGTYFTTVKFNKDGVKAWDARYRFQDDPYNTNEARKVALSPDGSIIVTGTSWADFATVGYDSSGQELWVKRYDESYGSSEPSALHVDKAGNIYVAGTSDTGEDPLGDWDDYILFKYKPIPGGIISRFSVPDAIWDAEGNTLRDGDTLNLATMSHREINIQAHTDPQQADSVYMVLDGPQHHSQMETAAPFALFGDNNGDYNAWIPAPGHYTVTATPYFNGIKGQPTTIRFYVLDQAVTHFVLVNADTDKDIAPLQYGDTLNLSALPTRNLNIRAVVQPEKVGSVVFNWNGTQRVENAAPYALGSDNAGNYHRWTPAPGEHSLTATPYAHKHGYGKEGAYHGIRFTVIDSLSLSGFTLLDADRDKPIMPLYDGAVIDLAQHPRINILAVPGIGRIGSVRFGLNERANYRLENHAPFALAANRLQDYLPWQAAPGTYTITATPFGQHDGAGKKGTALRISITLIHSTNLPAILTRNTQVGTPALAEKGLYLQAWPNPVATTGQVSFGADRDTYLSVELLATNGSRIQQLFAGAVKGKTPYRHTLSMAALPPGTYILSLVTQTGERRTQKMVKPSW
ncbi:delta-60 repeat domain-containing protein [Cnuella takakiae]|uniref:Delta-60 repeat domain-containing protein n=1 Tax=Cnuella takakiae TaxID=1302690 RepID=A0A1M4T5X6_9BACT|nr:SBBP repeat-containing protein [Cnuella takakiae]OLY90681.1 hypothetical protein BUE76_01275 [Cnuella takakiae]SHE39698.1 delta-60 repeat domain-containing protein [Cnuella takakiae]